VDEQHTEAERVDGQAARGSDDDYCSGYPLDGHAYISHRVNAAPIAWVERCHLCGHISSKALREQLATASTEPARIEGGRERIYVMPTLPTMSLDEARAGTRIERAPEDREPYPE
jgi:hypothetical protein